jgi:hypothetical protein
MLYKVVLKIKNWVGWIGLLSYLFVGMLSPQIAMAITSALAGSHHISVVTDANHQDIIFTHDHLQAHRHGHSHSLAHAHSHDADSESIFSNQKESHPDHVVHLSKPPEQISAQLPVLDFDFSQYFHHITLPTAVMVLVSVFLKRVSIQALPQPPPRLPSQLAILRTVILLI